MVESTNKGLVKDIASALTTQRQDELRIRASREKQNRSPQNIPAQLGVAHDQTSGSRGGGAAITSPLSEPNAGTRTFHAVPRRVSSTDGVFEIEIRDLKTIDMEDGAGAVVQFILAQPS
jgi:hypothetical protein